MKLVLSQGNCFIPDNGVIEEPRVLGLVMVPGRHIVSIHLDDITNYSTETM
jgi:hypothetical protein